MRARSLGCAIASAAIAIGGCGVAAFECASDDQCGLAQGGTCQPEGYCSFPDDTCDSGQRFGHNSGPYAGECTTPTIDTSTSTSTNTTTTTAATSIDGPAPSSTGAVADSSSGGAPGSTGAGESSSGSTGEPIDPDLLLWMRFDDATGTLVDSSQFGLTGECMGDACPAGVPGAFGEAVTFDGVDDRITVPHGAQFEDLTELTFSAWVQLAAEPTTTGLIAGKPVGAGIYDSFELFFLYNATNGYATLRFAVSDGAAHSVGVPPPFVVGRWFNVAGTWDGTTCTLYVEGLAQGSVACPGYAWSDHPVYVGADSNSGTISSFFGDAVDDVRLYNRVLSAEELLHLATDGEP